MCTYVFILPGLNIGTSNKGHKRALNREVCQVPGFNVLQWLLPKHANVPDIYFILMAMLLGQQIKSLPTDVQVNKFYHFQINLRNLFCCRSWEYLKYLLFGLR
jgi:hypothetical protein